jgi:hypothetical protein
MNRARHEPIALQPAQSQCQHALRDALYRPTNLIEPHRPAPRAQQLNDQHSPLVAYAGQRLADHSASGVISELTFPDEPASLEVLVRVCVASRILAKLLIHAAGRTSREVPLRMRGSVRGAIRLYQPYRLNGAPQRGGLIFVTRFQLSAFLRAHPVVTILAPVTNGNQAT